MTQRDTVIGRAEPAWTGGSRVERNPYTRRSRGRISRGSWKAVNEGQVKLTVVIKVAYHSMREPTRKRCVQRHCGYLRRERAVRILARDHQSYSGRRVGAGEIRTYSNQVLEAITLNVKRRGSRYIAINDDVVDTLKGTVAIVDK